MGGGGEGLGGEGGLSGGAAMGVRLRALTRQGDSVEPGPYALPELWVVNTRFSCLRTLHPDYSFVPHWRPSFISGLAAEDRCYLNGLAMVGGKPLVRYRARPNQ